MATPGPLDNDDDQPHSDDGARLRDIVRYVMKHTRLDEDSATKAVLDVLLAGLAMKSIVKTSRGKFVLKSTKPRYINYRIQEPRFSDDSSDSSDD